MIKFGILPSRRNSVLTWQYFITQAPTVDTDYGVTRSFQSKGFHTNFE